jgi:polycomb protein EED
LIVDIVVGTYSESSRVIIRGSDYISYSIRTISIVFFPTVAKMQPLSVKLEQFIQEDHKPAAIYCARFGAALPAYWNHFATVGSNCVSVYQVNHETVKMECLQVFVDEDIDEDFYACCWAANATDGTSPLLVVAGLRGILKVINCTTFVLEGALLGHGNSVNDLRTHPVNDELVLSASKDDSIRLWNLRTSVCIAIYGGEKGHIHGVLAIDVNPLGNCFLSSGIDNW